MNLSARTVLRTGVQTVHHGESSTSEPVASPCCGGTATVSRVLPEPVADSLAWGRPTITSREHPFHCSACGTAYIIQPTESGRVLTEV